MILRPPSATRPDTLFPATTLFGSVMRSIPAGSSSGKVMRLKGKGVSQKSGGRGDQLVRLMVDLPADDDALIKLLSEWTDPRNVRADQIGRASCRERVCKYV